MADRAWSRTCIRDRIQLVSGCVMFSLELRRATRASQCGWIKAAAVDKGGVIGLVRDLKKDDLERVVCPGR